jgi:hypothetical protein
LKMTPRSTGRRPDYITSITWRTGKSLLLHAVV